MERLLRSSPTDISVNIFGTWTCSWTSRCAFVRSYVSTWCLGKEETCAFRGSTDFASVSWSSTLAWSPRVDNQIWAWRGSSVVQQQISYSSCLCQEGETARIYLVWNRHTVHRGWVACWRTCPSPLGFAWAWGAVFTCQWWVQQLMALWSHSPDTCKNGMRKKAEGRNSSLLFLSLHQPPGISIDRISYEANIMSLTMSEITQLSVGSWVKEAIIQ